MRALRMADWTLGSPSNKSPPPPPTPTPAEHEGVALAVLPDGGLPHDGQQLLNVLQGGWVGGWQGEKMGGRGKRVRGT